MRRSDPPVLATTAGLAAAVAQRLPMLAVLSVLFLGFSFGPNLPLALLALAVFAIGWVILWRPGESAVLPITFCLHWVGAAVAVFHANWLGIELFSYSNFGGDMDRATRLSLVGVLCLAVGMRLGTGAWRPYEAATARRIALSHPVERWFLAYLLVSAASILALGLGRLVPGLTQVMLAVASLRWCFYYTLAYASFVRGNATGPCFALAFFVELALSVGGYFSEFRTVFLVTIFAAFASGLRLTGRMQAGFAALVAALLCLSVIWTSVKVDYRSFVSEGRKEQIVTVDYATRITKLAELTANLDAQAIELGVDHLIRRLSYVDFLSAVLGYVPNHLPHEDGALLADAVSRPFFPRALFPEKSVIDDTVRTNLYTGGLAGESEGTSISLGYIAETYIDFGVPGMFLALFGIGWTYGFTFRTLSRSRKAGPLLGMGLATFVLLSVGFLDSSITKTGGGFAVSLLVAWLVLKTAVPLVLRWTTVPGAGR
ncbi:hypothetical protein SAMN02799631_00784 [Methylobacterium sp. 174MFSha1.1]|uniref:hypothetical protein n=1 Tax=Methylobacterium sp. 174MFSha1.1 TaxID=1502749 RepID=UPI0008F1B712|nr:hypothetical protein [Methylobacterium sp. 174MFSha1.1]SFU46898.1 hypothetical protein SAMN02799631_00784 [Methylobacterium sp. 174MFSha1.1]